MEKKLIALALMGILTLGILTGCAAKAATTATNTSTTATAETKAVTLRVGAAVVPHAEILNSVKDKLKAEGVNLEVVVLDDEGQLNPALQDKQIDANYFQHVPYLSSIAKEKGYDFSVVAKVHVEPLGFYSQKLKAITELKEGSQIAIPNNASNEFRALVLLEKNGLIKLKPGIEDYKATPADIIENTKKLKFVEVDAAQLVRSLPDVDGAVINTNYILDAKIDPNTALFREDANSPYANIVVVRKGDENRPEIKKLVEALTSPETREFIKTKYGVAVVPAF